MKKRSRGAQHSSTGPGKRRSRVATSDSARAEQPSIARDELRIVLRELVAGLERGAPAA